MLYCSEQDNLRVIQLVSKCNVTYFLINLDACYTTIKALKTEHTVTAAEQWSHYLICASVWFFDCSLKHREKKSFFQAAVCYAIKIISHEKATETHKKSKMVSITFKILIS